MKTFTILAATALVAATATPVVSEISGPTPQAQAALQRGAVVRAADGVELGRLEGRRSNDGTPEIVVRGPDGQMRGIPAALVTIDGDSLRAGWSESQFRAAPTLVPAAVGSAATGAGGNQNPNVRTDPTLTPMTGRETVDEAARPAVEQQLQVDPRPQG